MQILFSVQAVSSVCKKFTKMSQIDTTCPSVQPVLKCIYLSPSVVQLYPSDNLNDPVFLQSLTSRLVGTLALAFDTSHRKRYHGDKAVELLNGETVVKQWSRVEVEVGFAVDQKLLGDCGQSYSEQMTWNSDVGELKKYICYT